MNEKISESPFKTIQNEENNNTSIDRKQSAFAYGLPSWNLEPPHFVVRRKDSK